MIDNVAIGVMSSINLKERYTACKETWLKDFEHTYLFGGNIRSDDLISLSSAGENWESAFLKQQLGLKYMYEDNSSYDWYNMSACDNILFKNKIITELKKYNSNEEYFISQPCGLWTDYPYLHELKNGSIYQNGIKFRAIAGGASFFVSNSLMKKIHPLIEDFNNEWTTLSKKYYGCSDVAISYMIKKYFNIDVTHVPYMFSQSPTHYKETYSTYNYNVLEYIKTPMSFHYIKPNEMKKIYEEYESNSNF